MLSFEAILYDLARTLLCFKFHFVLSDVLLRWNLVKLVFGRVVGNGRKYINFCPLYCRIVSFTNKVAHSTEQF